MRLAPGIQDRLYQSNLLRNLNEKLT